MLGVCLLLVALLGLVQPARAVTDGLRRWEGASLTMVGAATQVTVADRSGGVLYRRDINPGRQYQLVINGSGDKFSLRLSRQGSTGEYTYLHAPQGEISLAVSGADHVEVLIYSDTPGIYTVDSVALRECSSCGMEMQNWQFARLIRSSSGALYVSVKDAPGGVLFTQKLDRDRRYRLRIAGRGNNFTVRVTTRGDRGSMEYLPAPNGEKILNFSDITSIDVLVYSDVPAEYILREMRIDDCEDCRLSEDLVRVVRDAIPDLDQLGAYEKAVAIMRWASTAAHYTLDARQIPSDFESWPVYRQYFDFFLPSAGGASCGGIAVFTVNVMKLFDIDAMTINYGVPRSQGEFATHVSVVVKIADQFYLLDPTFAATVATDNGPLPLDQALLAVQQGAGKIRIADFDLSGRSNVGPRTITALSLCATRSVNANGVETCRIDPGLRFLDIFTESERDQWLSEGVRLDRESLVSLIWQGVFTIGDGTQSESDEQLAARLKNIGVPFHQ